MALWVFVLLGIFLNLSQGLESNDRGDVVRDQQVTGVLGEEVYLRCLYTGQNKIILSSWKRVGSTGSPKMAGYKYDGSPFYKENFYAPASRTNLTVNVSIGSFDMEGMYVCVFDWQDDETTASLILKVIARPEINTHVEDQVLNETWYQTVSCSALNAKPMALIHWQIRGVPLSEGIFSINTINSTHSNATFNITSVLRFPVQLNNESSVTCIVRHPALSEPRMTDIKLQTFVSPNVTMEVTLKQKEGKEFFQVLCTATGGRPNPDITWILPTSAHKPLSQEHDVGFESVARSHWFPSDLYEGENVTCIFGYQLRPAVHTRTVTLPTHYIDSLQLKNHSSDLLTLQEGSRGVISMDVMGNVPSYKINCTKDGEPLSEDVDVIGSDIVIKGPVSMNLSGQYQCQAFYYRHTAFLQFDVEVKPLLPVTFPPNISVRLWKEAGNAYIECLASDASPAPNVSWVLPQDLDGGIQSNITSSNGSHTVRSILTLPACLSKEFAVECVVEHLELADHEIRQITVPSCGPSTVTLLSSTVWKNGVAYEEVNCSAENMLPVPDITWDTENCTSGINASELSTVVVKSEPRQGNAESTVYLPVKAYAGCTVICTLEHQGLHKKSIHFPSISPPAVHLSVGPLKDSSFWAALCEYRGEGVVPNISLVISDHNTTTALMSIPPIYEGIKVLVNATYKFMLSQHEGKNLTFVIRNDYGEEERKTVHIPKYFISSIVVLNKTSQLRGNHGQHTVVKRVALKEDRPNQKIIFKVHGNIPKFNLECVRADGSAAHTDATGLVFTDPVTEKDAGLYKCCVSWYHHQATVNIQVDVTSQESHYMTFILICFSSAAALTLFLFVTVCVFCKRSGESHPSKKDRKQRESLAGLMQTPCSPDINKAPISGGKGAEYAELVPYSIVFDMKSPV